jgi:hypothetical protein
VYSVVGAFSRSMPAQPTHVNAVVEIRLGCGQDIKRHTACGEPLLKAPSNCERDRRDSRCAAATASFSSFDYETRHSFFDDFPLLCGAVLPAGGRG